MREIKFRGLRTDGKGWEYGCLKHWKHFNGKGYEVVYSIFNGDYEFLVAPKSVGQFTGLKDKNGNDIYEGDLVTLKDHDCVITYRNNYCDFVFHIEKLNWRLLNLTKSNITKYKSEIIGNIHEK